MALTAAVSGNSTPTDSASWRVCAMSFRWVVQRPPGTKFRSIIRWPCTSRMRGQGHAEHVASPIWERAVAIGGISTKKANFKRNGTKSKTIANAPFDGSRCGWTQTLEKMIKLKAEKRI
eukprot:EG_transcript_24106